MRISPKESKEYLLSSKNNKYNNQKPEYYDADLKKKLKFDSIKEYEYYLGFTEQYIIYLSKSS